MSVFLVRYVRLLMLSFDFSAGDALCLEDQLGVIFVKEPSCAALAGHLISRQVDEDVLGQEWLEDVLLQLGYLIVGQIKQQISVIIEFNEGLFKGVSCQFVFVEHNLQVHLGDVSLGEVIRQIEAVSGNMCYLVVGERNLGAGVEQVKGIHSDVLDLVVGDLKLLEVYLFVYHCILWWI